jgi:hypothetical protein
MATLRTLCLTAACYLACFGMFGSVKRGDWPMAFLCGAVWMIAMALISTRET